jgi:prophage endopeptidase
VNVQIYLIAALGFVLGLTGAYIKGRSDGGQLVVSEYAQQALTDERINAETTAGIAARYREKERKQASALAAVSKDYQKRLANVETQRLADAAALDARTLVLRGPNSTGGKSCGSGAAETPPASGGRDGAQGSELPQATSRFLLGLASEADAVVHQLTACQAVLEDERK